MDMTNDEWIEQAFKAHGLISVKIGATISELNLGNVQGDKKTLKEALALIDQLDFLLESYPEKKDTYKKTYHALMVLLEILGLRPWAIDALQEQFGADYFFVMETQSFT